jgi:acyl-CoA oxidase
MSWFVCMVFDRFIEKLQQDVPGHGVKEQLQNLCNVYALHLLHKHLGDFLATGCITPKQGALANEQLGKLYAQVCRVDLSSHFIFVSL